MPSSPAPRAWQPRACLFAALTLFSLAQLRAASVSLTELDLTHLHVAGWSAPRVDLAFNGRPISIGKQTYPRGLGTRATSTLWLELDGRADRLVAQVGVDDAA